MLNMVECACLLEIQFQRQLYQNMTGMTWKYCGENYNLEDYLEGFLTLSLPPSTIPPLLTMLQNSLSTIEDQLNYFSDIIMLTGIYNYDWPKFIDAVQTLMIPRECLHT